MIIMGFDAGNSETTVAVRIGSRVHHLTFPSSVGTGDYAELLRVRSGAGRAANLEADEYTIVHRGVGLFVGRLALEQARDASSGRGNSARYSNGHTLAGRAASLSMRSR